MDYTKDIREYIALEQRILGQLDVDAINECLNLLDETRLKKGRIYICGNGGSAATASHFQNDFNKGVSEYIDLPFRFHCLNDNVATLMAIANDIGYEEVFRFQLRGVLETNDVLHRLCWRQTQRAVRHFTARAGHEYAGGGRYPHVF